MNILIPYNWLLEHLDTNATPEDISKYLSLCGPTVERIEKIEGEPVFDIEVTTNRVDSMSVRGIAREAAAILPQFAIKAKLKPLKLLNITSHNKLAITIQNNPKLCHRILAIKLENCKISSSPQWLQKRLIQVGQRPLNNIIDITNYIMWEIGHPIHAFDYDKISTKKIIVRVAKKSEKAITLDDKTHIFKGGEVIFDDGTGNIIDIPGIMGTKNTVVSEKTKSVLLWIESIDAKKIRNASMGLAIRSQAAVLNEKHVDSKLGLTAILKAVELYKKVANATIASKIVDIYPKKPPVKTCLLSQKLVDTYLGLKVDPKKISRILTKLGCSVKTQKSKVKGQLSNVNISYLITPPSWRSKDLRIPQDYIEEIARIYGYHNLPSLVMDTPIPDNPPKENFNLEYKVKQILAGWGLQEVYTYSMISKELASQSGFPTSKHLKIKNPLTEDFEFMRRSLIPSHLDVIEKNKNQGDLTIFEMANVYHPRQNNLPNEELQLVITTNENYKKIKGILDALSEKLFLKNNQIIPIEISQKPFLKNKTAELYSNKIFIGFIGMIDQNITNQIFSIQLLVKPLIKIARSHPRFIPLISTPPIIEDLTFTLPQKTYLGEVLEIINSSSKYIEKVFLSKTYNQNYTFTIIYRHHNKSLTDKNIYPIRRKIVSIIEKHFKAKLVGKV